MPAWQVPLISDHLSIVTKSFFAPDRHNSVRFPVSPKNPFVEARPGEVELLYQGYYIQISDTLVKMRFASLAAWSYFTTLYSHIVASSYYIVRLNTQNSTPKLPVLTRRPCFFSAIRKVCEQFLKKTSKLLWFLKSLKIVVLL